jgi:hypothetical protein
MRRRRLLAAPCSLALVVLATRGAHAGDPDAVKTAKGLFDRAVEQMDAKAYDKACPALDQSYQLDPKPGTLFALADCEAARGHVAAAYARYGQYLSVYAALGPDKQKKQGTRQKEAGDARAALAPQVPEIRITVSPGAPAGTVVTCDGKDVDPGAIGGPLQLDPGEHVLTARAPGGAATEQRVTLARGDKRSVTLVVQGSAPADAAAGAHETATPAEPAAGPSGRRIAAYVIGGAGALGVVIGAVTGGLMLSKKGAISMGCKDLGNGVESCTPAGAAAGNSAKTLGAASSAGFVLGLVGLGVGAALFFTEPKPGAAQGGAASISLGLISLGPETTAGLRGRF